MGSPPTNPNPSPPEAGQAPSTGQHPHDFEVQKQIHRQIRNDPDYDDWEYGTEPLPHEAWMEAQSASGKPAPGADAAG